MDRKTGQIIVSSSTPTRFTSIAAITVVLKSHPTNTNVVWVGNDGNDSVNSMSGFPVDVGESIIINLDGNINELYALAEVNGEKICWIIVD